MANKLSDEVKALTQRTGTNTGRLRTEQERSAFSANVRADLASIIYQLNVVYKPLIEKLSSTDNLNALDFGLAGNVMFTHIAATEADAFAYYDASLVRPRTIKETIDVLLSELARLENLVEVVEGADEYDDTELRNLIAGNSLDLEQLAKDAMGDEYTLDGDGEANLVYSLAQAVDAIGAFFSGYPGTGNTYTDAYPPLSFSVLLSDVVIDTTLPITTISGLFAQLSAIRNFIGMATVGPESPVYSDHGSTTIVSDGDSLEQAIAALDVLLATHALRHLSGGADEVDGDKLDIDYNPSNYTPDIAPPVVTSAAHLSAHLAGLDNAVGTLGVKTLQGAYNDGGAGTAGDIQLQSLKGPLRIKDDTGTPLHILTEWLTTAGAVAALMRDNYFHLKADVGLRIDEFTGAPLAVSGAGFVHTLADPSSSETELWYRSSDGAMGNAQVTRDGIVKELEVGHDWLGSGDWTFDGTATDITRVIHHVPTPNQAHRTWDFGTQVRNYLWGSVGVPRDEDGDTPTRIRCILYHMAFGGSGNTWQYTLDITDDTVGAFEVVEDNELVNQAWRQQGLYAPSANPAIVNRVYMNDTGIVTLPPKDVPALLNFRLSRQYLGGGVDDWDSAVSLIGMKVVWYR